MSRVKLENVLIPACVRGFATDTQATTFDVRLENGLVAEIQPTRLTGQSVPSGTLLPGLVDAHVHIDKTFVVDETGAPDGDLFKAIALMAEHRKRWSGDDIRARMERALSQAYACGTRAMRTHLDWDGSGAPVSLAVFEQLRDKWRGRIALQCVSLTALDMLDVAAPAQALELSCGEHIARQVAHVNQGCDASRGEAALLGAFVYRNTDLREKLGRLFALAARYQLGLDFHVDEGLDADACGLRTIAELSIQYHYQGKVTCGHACSLAIQPLDEALQTLQLCAQAGIHLVSLPTTNLYLQGAWGTTPVERGITRLNEARRLGVSTSIATDNVADGFYPYGSYDLLDSFGLGVQVAHLSPPDVWLQTITTNPARAMQLPWDGSISVGCPADLVLLAARSQFELLTPAGRKRQVIRHGAVLEINPGSSTS